ncbi:molybdenum cofactor guanylyltransferase [Paraglaciecola sp.]|uniref:molybdenum cofactor guanylyltransferase n=1 Tax=Paraglaciecola sp. TaxID=1920173 RepID=UPI003EF7D2B5
MLAGVILAGGRSSRMGQDKGLLIAPDQQLSLLILSQQTMAKLVGESVWVSGEQHHQGIPDIFKACGPLSGIHSALSYFQNNQQSITEVLFMPVDMPRVTESDLRHLLEQGRKHQTLCCYQDHMFPLYVPLSIALIEYLAIQLKRAGDTKKKGKNKSLSIRNVLQKFDAAQIKPLTQSNLVNINTQQEWQQHCAYVNKSKATNTTRTNN